jgi:ribosomal 50S subunit-recycling heat shock protein
LPRTRRRSSSGNFFKSKKLKIEKVKINRQETSMRIDKFLKISRLVKRRTVAKEMADQGRVSVNGKTVKSSYNVVVGDVIAVAYGTRVIKARVLDLRETTKKAEAGDLYELVD